MSVNSKFKIYMYKYLKEIGFINVYADIIVKIKIRIIFYTVKRKDKFGFLKCQMRFKYALLLLSAPI